MEKCKLKKQRHKYFFSFLSFMAKISEITQEAFQELFGVLPTEKNFETVRKDIVKHFDLYKDKWRILKIHQKMGSSDNFIGELGDEKVIPAYVEFMIRVNAATQYFKNKNLVFFKDSYLIVSTKKSNEFLETGVIGKKVLTEHEMYLLS